MRVCIPFDAADHRIESVFKLKDDKVKALYYWERKRTKRAASERGQDNGRNAGTQAEGRTPKQSARLRIQEIYGSLGGPGSLPLLFTPCYGHLEIYIFHGAT